jgi:16S rRNA (uracil1498-N3)-methyltransferase
VSRFFVQPGSVKSGNVIIKGEEFHHAKDVMRLGQGDEIAVFDGTGREYYGVITDIGKEQMSVALTKTAEIKTETCRLTLVQALPKSDKMDLIVEKATELGVARIIPVVSDRTIVRPDAGKYSQKAERWRKISVVAAKQCGRTTIPEITDIASFEASLALVRDSELKIIPCLYDGVKSIKTALGGGKTGSAAVFIGQEGDFTRTEVEAAIAAGAIPVSLGVEVLRSETAAICALSLLNYELRW